MPASAAAPLFPSSPPPALLPDAGPGRRRRPPRLLALSEDEHLRDFTDDQLRVARLAICAAATDIADAELLLDMVGLR